MRFNSQRDYSTMIQFNKELINVVIDAIVVLLKLNVSETKLNVYGESSSKESYTAIRIPCLINRQPSSTFEDAGTINVRQPITFSFLREELRDRNIYPENGDIVWWDNQYFEIDNVNEIQQYANQQEYNHNVTCDAHITHKRDLPFDRPNK